MSQTLERTLSYHWTWFKLTPNELELLTQISAPISSHQGSIFKQKMGIKPVVFSGSTCTEEALFLVLNRTSTPQSLLSSHWSHSGRGNRNKSQIQCMHAVTAVLCTQLESCMCEFAVVVTACQRPVPSSSVTTLPPWKGR